MSQAEDMLSEVPDEGPGTGVSDDLADADGSAAGAAADASPAKGTGVERDVNTGPEADADHEAGPGGETSAAASEARQAAAVDGAGPGIREDGRGTGEGPETDLEQEGEIAADYVEGLLDIADLDGDIDMDVEGDRAVVSVVGARLDELVGRRGEVLEALQELTRLAVHRQTGTRASLMLDIGGYRAQRRAELAAMGRDAAAEVGSSGVPRPLEPMTPFERKVVHDAVAEAGCRSESEGEEPNRRVVVYPAE